MKDVNFDHFAREVEMQAKMFNSAAAMWLSATKMG